MPVTSMKTIPLHALWPIAVKRRDRARPARDFLGV